MQIDVRKQKGKPTSYRFADKEGGTHKLHVVDVCGINVNLTGDHRTCPKVHVHVSDVPHLIEALEQAYAQADKQFKDK